MDEEADEISYDRSGHICPVCRARFSSRSSLFRHVRSVHENQRRFRCDQCDYSANQSSNLERHRRAKHQVHNSTPVRLPRQKRHVMSAALPKSRAPAETSISSQEIQIVAQNTGQLTSERRLNTIQGANGVQQSNATGDDSPLTSVQSSSSGKSRFSSSTSSSKSQPEHEVKLQSLVDDNASNKYPIRLKRDARSESDASEDSNSLETKTHAKTSTRSLASFSENPVKTAKQDVTWSTVKETAPQQPSGSAVSISKKPHAEEGELDGSSGSSSFDSDEVATIQQEARNIFGSLWMEMLKGPHTRRKKENSSSEDDS